MIWGKQYQPGGSCSYRSHDGIFTILREMGMEAGDVAVICSAIGQHDEQSGSAVDAVSAALILADKTDVRNRVRNRNKATFDKHDQVNYAAVSSNLKIDMDKKP